MRNARALAAGLCAVVAAAGGVAVATGDREGEPADAVRTLGATDGRDRIDFSLTLRLADRRLDRFLRAQQDPGSAEFGSRLSPRAFGERFGPETSELAAVEARLRDAGIEVTQAYPQRTSLRVGGPAAAVSDFLGVSLRDFADGAGNRWHAPTGPVAVPAALRGAVRGVAGLDNRPRPAVAAAAPTEGLARADLENAYGLKALHDQGYTGEGQTIAIMGFEAFAEEDVAGYDELTGTEGPPVERVEIDGGVNQPGSGEIHLDIDVVRAVAPKAQILSYEGPNDGTFATMVDKLVADGRADIVSLSWGRCDVPEYFAPGAREADLQAFRAAAAAGVSIFVASGDSGAYGCQHGDITDATVSVDFPSTSADVVTVGGTRLSVRENGSYLEEAGWEDVVSAGGGGGGLSVDQPRPDYQNAPGVENDESTGMRQVPDVAAAADPDSGYLVVDQGEQIAVGGTSGAAPFWASSMLLVREYVAENGGPEALGYVNPTLYAIAREEGARSPFNDVVKGGNRLHNATPGWDYSTGLGSADMFELAQAFAQRLRD